MGEQLIDTFLPRIIGDDLENSNVRDTQIEADAKTACARRTYWQDAFWLRNSAKKPG